MVNNLKIQKEKWMAIKDSQIHEVRTLTYDKCDKVIDMTFVNSHLKYRRQPQDDYTYFPKM